jgi:hypothetical protein
MYTHTHTHARARARARKHARAHPLAGLGHEYDTALAVGPLQKLLTYSRGEVVLTSPPAWAWRLVEEWLVPLAEGLGYKASAPPHGGVGFGAEQMGLEGRGRWLAGWLAG